MVRRSRLGKALQIVFGLVFLWYIASVWQVTRPVPPVDNTLRADALIVLGCGPKAPDVPSECQRNRTATAVALWRNGISPHLIFTGGDTGRGIESRMMAGLAIQSGVPASAIVTEERAHDTVENIRYSRPILAEHGWSRVVLVSDGYHLYRAGLMAECQGVALVGRGAVPSSVPPVFIFDPLISAAREGGALMLFEVTQWSACT